MATAASGGQKFYLSRWTQGAEVRGGHRDYGRSSADRPDIREGLPVRKIIDGETSKEGKHQYNGSLGGIMVMRE